MSCSLPCWFGLGLAYAQDLKIDKICTIYIHLRMNAPDWNHIRAFHATATDRVALGRGPHGSA
jgi:hypothetical protein